MLSAVPVGILIEYEAVCSLLGGSNTEFELCKYINNTTYPIPTRGDAVRAPAVVCVRPGAYPAMAATLAARVGDVVLVTQENHYAHVAKVDGSQCSLRFAWSKQSLKVYERKDLAKRSARAGQMLFDARRGKRAPGSSRNPGPRIWPRGTRSRSPRG